MSRITDQDLKEARKDEIGLVLATIAERYTECKKTHAGNDTLEGTRREVTTLATLEGLVYRLYGDKGMYYLSTLDYEDSEARHTAQIEVIESIAGVGRKRAA